MIHGRRPARCGDGREIHASSICAEASRGHARRDSSFRAVAIGPILIFARQPRLVTLPTLISTVELEGRPLARNPDGRWHSKSNMPTALAGTLAIADTRGQHGRRRSCRSAIPLGITAPPIMSETIFRPE